MLRKISIMLLMAIMLNLFFSAWAAGQAKAGTAFPDSQSHWAVHSIERWLNLGLIKGYTDGTFKPDRQVTRAEFVTILNVLFGFSVHDNANFSDVANDTWYADGLGKAKSAGYLQGYPDNTVHPNEPMSRQDTAVILARVFNINKDVATPKEPAFTDAVSIADYAQSAVQALAVKGYINGYADQSFRPEHLVSRAEVLTILDKMVGQYYSVSGSYSDAVDKGNVVVNTKGVLLKNRVIEGNLYLTEGIGDGDVTLNNVIVKGVTMIAGGGKNSIHIEDSNLGNVMVNSNKGTVRVVVSGSSSIGETSIQTSAILEENNMSTGSGFTDIVIDKSAKTAAEVNFTGDLNQFTVNGAITDIKLNGGILKQLTLNAKTNIVLQENANLGVMTVNEKGKETSFDMKGKVEKVVIQADQVRINDQLYYQGDSLTIEGKTNTILTNAANSDHTNPNGVAGNNAANGSNGSNGSGGSNGSNGSNGNNGGQLLIDMIDDGEFNHGIGAWGAFWGDDNTGTSVGSISAENGELKTVLQSIGSSASSAQILRQGLSFISGTTYTVSFDVRSTVERKMNVLISGDNVSLATPRTFVTTPSKKNYVYSFTMKSSSLNNGKISFELGTIAGENKAPAVIFLDNVHITALAGTIADKTNLNAKIGEAFALQEMQFTADSWSLFHNALVTAQETSFSITATKGEIDQALAGLNEAIQKLVKLISAKGLSDITVTDNEGNDLLPVMNPAFKPDKLSYLIGARNSTMSVSLSPQLAAGNTIISVNGSQPSGNAITKTLQTGKNEIALEVGEPGKVNKTYHFYVIKEGSGAVRRNASDWTLSWQDEFNGNQIDSSKWNFVNQGGGFGNREMQYYTPREENARIEPIDEHNKALVIEARKENYGGEKYTSAKLFSQNKGDWTYGKFDIRAKLPKSQGLWPAIWMMPTNYGLYGDWPATGEIDIMELIGNKPNEAWGTLHYGMPWKYSNESFVLPGSMDFSQEFHTFTIEWEPGEIRWYVDGIFYQKQSDWYTQRTGESAPYTWPAPFDRDFYLQLNLAVGGEWPQFPDSTTVLPSRMEVDYVRVYKLKDGISYREPGNGPERVISVPTPRMESGLGGLIYNGTFDEGLNRMQFWDFLKDGSAAASSSVGSAITQREFKASLDNGGTSKSSVQLIQSGIPLVKNRQYLVKFKARASFGAATIEVNAGKVGVSYSGTKSFDLNNEMKEYSFIFAMDEAADNNARLQFNMGLNTGDIVIDDVKMITYYPAKNQKIEAEAFNNVKGFSQMAAYVVPDGSNSNWIQYNVNIPLEGDYVISYRISTDTDTAKLTFKGTEADTRTLHLWNTGGFQQWKTITDLVHLKAGTQVLVLSGTGYQLDYFDIAPNKVLGGGMNTNTNDWELWVQKVAGAAVAIDQQKAKITITDQGDDFWGTQFSQKGIELLKNKKYRISFDAKSTVNRKLRMVVDDPIIFTPYALYDSISLTPQWKTYNFEFTMEGATNLNGRIDFNLGKIGDVLGAHEIYIDDVKFEEISDIELAASKYSTISKDVPGDEILVESADGFTGIESNQGLLTPVFNAGISAYTKKVATDVTSIAITPALAEGNTISAAIGAVNSNGIYTAALNEGENVISFVVEQAERIPRTYTITVIRTPVNLAKGRSATASSGNGALAVDGNMTSRWESSHSDPQWINVDLGDNYNISSIKVNWETARAKDYTIELSQDNIHWKQIFGTTSGSGALDTISLPDLVTARYVYLKGTARVGTYGYSIYELEVAGQSYSSAADFRAFKGKLISKISEANALAQSDYSADTWASMVDVLQQAATVKANLSAAQQTVDDVITALNDAIAALRKLTKADGFTALAISSGTLTPAFMQDTLTYDMFVDSTVDSVNLTPVLAVNNEVAAITGLTVTTGVYKADLNVGHNTVSFVISKPGAEIMKTYTIHITKLSANAALLQPAIASSGNANAATDGDGGSRWTSGTGNQEWIYVDLGTVKNITAVAIDWETASAKEYKIQISDDASNSSWIDAAAFSKEGIAFAARTDMFALSAVGRYVRVYAINRNTPWDYSIYELKVFTQP